MNGAKYSKSNIGSIFDQSIVIWIHLSRDFHAIHLILVYVFQNPLYL